MKELVFAGFGGQGVLTAGLIVSYIAMQKGKNVTWMPSYGPTMRGGKANSVVKISDGEIGGPNMEETDILVAMNEPSLEYMKFLKPNGTLICNSDAVSENYKYRDDIEVIKVPCSSISDQIKNPKASNLVMIGAMIKHSKLFEKEEAIQEMKGFFERKGYEKFNEVNVVAFIQGYEYI